MTVVINARELRSDLGRIVRLAREGQRFRVLYRSRVAFDIVPPGEETEFTNELADETLYGASAVGASSDGQAARNHDRELYT
ncbi:MAG: hypothetical protein EOM20_16975 [Spartobacteria bacterium]|nr:hypothetical protein [Spartobacteria bacterium]